VLSRFCWWRVIRGARETNIVRSRRHLVCPLPSAPLQSGALWQTSIKSRLLPTNLRKLRRKYPRQRRPTRVHRPRNLRKQLRRSLMGRRRQVNPNSRRTGRSRSGGSRRMRSRLIPRHSRSRRVMRSRSRRILRSRPTLNRRTPMVRSRPAHTHSHHTLRLHLGHTRCRRFHRAVRGRGSGD
jgi:hypothetical protein